MQRLTPLERGGKEGTGRWGEPTGLIDWCEPNYALMSDVAELHNTWSNVFYVLVGAAVLARCRRLRLPRTTCSWWP